VYLGHDHRSEDLASAAACMNLFMCRPLLPFVIEVGGGLARDQAFQPARLRGIARLIDEHSSNQLRGVDDHQRGEGWGGLPVSILDVHVHVPGSDPRGSRAWAGSHADLADMSVNNEFTIFGRPIRHLVQLTVHEPGTWVGILERCQDGEVAVEILESVRRKEVFLMQPVNDHLIELLASADACRRTGAARHASWRSCHFSAAGARTSGTIRGNRSWRG
jgi:hypothetical protein